MATISNDFRFRVSKAVGSPSVQGAAYYRVAYKKSGGSWQYQNVSGTQIDFTNPTANSTYYFSVYAVGENGTSSDWSPDYYVYT